MLLAIASVALVAFGIPVAGAAGDDAMVVPAPLADPAVCGYFRLREGFDRLMQGGAAPVPPVATAPERVFLNAFHVAAQVRDQVRAKARGDLATPSGKHKPGAGSETPEQVIQSIRAFCTARAFVPEDLFVFFRGPGEYAVMLTGSVTPQAWESLFDASARIPRAAGFTVNPGGTADAAGRSMLHVGPGYLLLAPAGLEGNLLDALQAGATLDGEKWKTFRRMVGLRPVAALEADMESFADRQRGSGTGDSALPFPYDRIMTFRCLVDARVIKAQLYAPDENARTLLRQAAGVVVKAARSAAVDSLFAESVSSIRESMQQTSVFIEGRGLDRNASLAGVSTLGMLSQFVCRALPEVKAD